MKFVICNPQFTVNCFVSFVLKLDQLFTGELLICSSCRSTTGMHKQHGLVCPWSHVSIFFIFETIYYLRLFKIYSYKKQPQYYRKFDGLQCRIECELILQWNRPVYGVTIGFLFIRYIDIFCIFRPQTLGDYLPLLHRYIRPHHHLTVTKDPRR